MAASAMGRFISQPAITEPWLSRYVVLFLSGRVVICPGSDGCSDSHVQRVSLAVCSATTRPPSTPDPYPGQSAARIRPRSPYVCFSSLACHEVESLPLCLQPTLNAYLSIYTQHLPTSSLDPAAVACARELHHALQPLVHMTPLDRLGPVGSTVQLQDAAALLLSLQGWLTESSVSPDRMSR